MLKDASGRTIIYDAFVRDNHLTLISTFYGRSDTPMQIRVDGVSAIEYGVNAPEPIHYFKAPVKTVPKSIHINGVKHQLNISELRSTKRGIGIATLFKDDHHHIPAFLAFYRKLGVEYFYLYFNGPVLPAGLPVGTDIHYGLWDFPYWNHTGADDPGGNTGWKHNAQMTFISMIRNKFMPDHTWLGIIDLDEYVLPTSGKTLLQELNSSDKDVVIVLNHWARRDGNIITYTTEAKPYRTRSKAFYKGSFPGLVGIHFPKNNPPVTISTSLKMLHLVTNNHPDRLKLVTEPLQKCETP